MKRPPTGPAPGAMDGLSAEQIDSYFERGYFGPLRMLSRDEADAAAAMARRVTATAGLAPAVSGEQVRGRLLGMGSEPAGAPQIECRHLDNEEVLALCRHPRLIAAVSSLYRTDMKLWRTTFIVKGPGGPEFDWHQDFGGVFGRGQSYGLEPPFHFSVWLALTPAEAETGCLRFIPGVRRVLRSRLACDAPNATLLVEPDEVDEAEAVDMVLDPGECVIFTDRALHGSRPNASAAGRIGFAMRLTAPFVRVRPLFPGHRSLPLRGEERGSGG